MEGDLRPRLGGIDALRGLAILLVVAYHAGPLAFRLPPYRADGWLELPSLGVAWLAVPLLHFGYSGVHLFFVLSGFCIHLRVARAGQAPRRPPPRLREFFLRRFYRIYPPYWIALVGFGLVLPWAAAWLGHRASAGASGRDLAAHALMLHTFSTRTIFSINPAFWSLATEEQFYLAYPLVLLATRRFRITRVLVAALVLSLVWRAVLVAWVPPMPPTAERLMDYRVWVHAFFVPRWVEWLLGCALAELVAAPSRSWMRHRRGFGAAAAVLLVAAMACRLHVAVDKLLADTLFSSGYAALAAAWLAEPRTRARSRPAWAAVASKVAASIERALAAVGRRAYGIYLMHQPILDGVALALPWRLALGALASVAFSAWCERPFERLSQRVGRVPRDGDAPRAQDGDASAGA